jgi:[ribosomal protein S18]-alanine N-acetyltransferase
MKVVIADAVRADEFARVHASAFAAPWSASAFHGTLLGFGAVGLIAEDEGRALGVAIISAAGDEAEVLTIGTAPEARRRGCARALMEFAHAEARRRGARVMFLEVAADNHSAHALYDSLGYRPAGVRKNYYVAGRETPADALVLRRELAP